MLSDLDRRGEALALALELMRSAEARGDRAERALALQTMARMRFAEGDFAGALAGLREALCDMEAAGDARGCAMLRGNMGLVCLEAGDTAVAIDALEQTIAASRAAVLGTARQGTRLLHGGHQGGDGDAGQARRRARARGARTGRGQRRVARLISWRCSVF